nr:transcription factor bHLH18-like [Ipomoea batatas]
MYIQEVDDAAFVNEWMDTLDNNFAHFCPNDPFFPPAFSTGNNGFYGTENSDGGVIRKPAVINSVQFQPPAYSSFANSASPLITAVSCNPSGCIENPVVKVMKMKSEMDHRESSGKTMISFMPSPSHQDYYCSGRGNHEHRESLIRRIEFGAGKGKTGSAIRTPLQAQDHVLAERKRREKLTQQFISLSALIPGLKKLDKASVLGDAIKYIKELQERVRTLEVDQEQTKRLENDELKRRISGHDEDSSSLSDDGSCETRTDIALPEIEVRASGQNLLIRVHCNNLHNHGGVIKEIFSEIERLHLSINTSHVMPFGNTTYITIAAQKEERCPRENNSLLKTQPAMAMDMNMIELLEEEGIKAMEKASRHVGDEDIKAERPEEEHGDGEENDNGDTEEEVPAEEDPCHLRSDRKARGRTWRRRGEQTASKKKAIGRPIS